MSFSFCSTRQKIWGSNVMCRFMASSFSEPCVCCVRDFVGGSFDEGAALVEWRRFMDSHGRGALERCAHKHEIASHHHPFVKQEEQTASKRFKDDVEEKKAKINQQVRFSRVVCRKSFFSRVAARDRVNDGIEVQCHNCNLYRFTFPRGSYMIAMTQ